MTNDAKKSPKVVPPEAVQDMTLDAALEHLMLDAQLVAHAQSHGRKSFLESEQRSELRAVIGEVGNVMERDGKGVLAMLGVTMSQEQGELQFRALEQCLLVRAGVDGVIEVGDRAVRPSDPFYSDALYREIQRLVLDWAVAVAGDAKTLWSRKD